MTLERIFLSIIGVFLIIILVFGFSGKKKSSEKSADGKSFISNIHLPSMNLIMPAVLAVGLYFLFLFIVIRNQCPNFWDNWYGSTGSLFWGSNAILFLSIWLRVRYYWYGATWVAIATGIIVISTCTPWA